jgi:hypothetical protein
VRFAGYAAVFGVADRGGDVVRAGAFGDVAGKAGVPLLWQHRGDAPIGRVEYLAEDARGLRVIGRLADSAAGAEAARALSAGRIDGLSFGYRVREARRVGDGRELVALELVEVSLVAVPMQTLARVHAIDG